MSNSLDPNQSLDETEVRDFAARSEVSDLSLVRLNVGFSPML